MRTEKAADSVTHAKGRAIAFQHGKKASKRVLPMAIPFVLNIGIPIFRSVNPLMRGGYRLGTREHGGRSPSKRETRIGLEVSQLENGKPLKGIDNSYTLEGDRPI